MRQKFVVKLDLRGSEREKKVFKALSKLAGVESVTADLKDGKITVVGDGVDPVLAVCKLRRLFGHAVIVSVKELNKDDRKDEKVKKEERKDERGADKSFPPPPFKLTVEFLQRITNNFSEEHIIGFGRYGVVYKGVLDNGACIAMKKLHLMPGLDVKEFKNEFNNLMRVQHQNIIQFLGYCHHTTQVLVKHDGKHVSAKVEEIYLCSEYLQGGSLDKHLSNEPCALVWHTCYKIIKGLCEGLHYLHKGFEYPIYHLELKPTKVLLDKDMMPKIGGFGFSRVFASVETTNTSEVTRTRVYMPPEYISKQQITPKFDVFSLGIIILQIMAGKESYTKCADTSPEEFIELVYELWVNRVQGTISKHISREVRTCIEIALKCVESNQVKRPTINEIIRRLNKIDIVECSSNSTREFAFQFLERITNGFSEQNKVGSGGYGKIYKGVLDNGEEIAVKKLRHLIDIYDKRYKNEIEKERFVSNTCRVEALTINFQLNPADLIGTNVTK